MKTVVITGGNDGIGRGLVHARLERGDRVVVVGSNADKGQRFLAEAEKRGVGEGAHFVAADLSLVSESRRVVGQLTESFGALDALVLCARFFRSARAETAEGYESTFALEYLSRYVLSHGLTGVLEKSESPVIVNVSGPGVPKPPIRWDDPHFRAGYDGLTAQRHAGMANDLLGVAYAARNGSGRTRYVLVNPGSTATSFAGEYDPVTKYQVEAIRRMGKPVKQAVAPISEVIDAPPAEPLSAFVEGRRIGVDDPQLFDHEAAARLAEFTEQLLAR
ncbi:SDR family NAD(P)-dependent oxidoreductase [Streptomyces sp. NPDC017086]|uniref:SDR family NAD(P)-dependent oxidoreductase n=1 Tax=Streptomyces sp. NPDC017086 TaxID=3364976 RepID=UPI0037A70B38